MESVPLLFRPLLGVLSDFQMKGCRPDIEGKIIFNVLICKGTFLAPPLLKVYVHIFILPSSPATFQSLDVKRVFKPAHGSKKIHGLPEYCLRHC